MPNHLALELKELLNSSASAEVATEYRRRLVEGKLTRDENPTSHFCVYFAPYDAKAKQLFIGHHIKAGLWLFNGGHIDEGETARETVIREIGEEWGLDAKGLEINGPALLTLTPIENPAKQICRLHFDIWHFIGVDKDTFQPDPEKLAEELHSVAWMDMAQARQMVSDPSTHQALNFIEANYFNK